MNKEEGTFSISELLTRIEPLLKNDTTTQFKQQRLRTIQKWQELALEIIIWLNSQKKASIFKLCKKNQYLAKIVFEDCKELNRKNEMYFFKVFNILYKKQYEK